MGSRTAGGLSGIANFSEKFILQTDASGAALRAVLSQERNGVRQPIAYASRTLSAQELGISITTMHLPILRI